MYNKYKNIINTFCIFTVFELLERGEVLVVPTDHPLNERDAWLAFRDVILGLEYCKLDTCKKIAYEM